MALSRIRKPTLIILSLMLALAVLSLAPQPAAPASGGNAIALKAPSFVRVANAQEGAGAQDAPEATPMGFPQDEAGISAYFKSASPINLANVRSVFRVIEAETADYIIGSVPVPDWWESYDVHLYVHRTGWFLAYYLNTDVAGKIIDWKRYTGTSVPTKLETVLAIAADAAGVPASSPSFYDFRYPNATNMMLVVEDTANGNEFSVIVPSSHAYYSRSWSLVSDVCGTGYSSSLTLDGAVLKTHNRGYNASEDGISASKLLPDALHSVVVSAGCGWANGALVLLYRVP